MSLYKGKGIILKTLDFGESDRLVTLFSRDWGKIRVVARKARGEKARFTFSLTPMNYVEIVFFGRENRSLFLLNTCEVLKPFQALRSDLKKLLAALYLLDIVEALTPEGEANRPAFSLLLEILSLIQAFDSSGPLLRLFEIRLLDYIGYRFEIEKCLFCRNTCKPVEVRFSPTGSGIVCLSCRERAKEVVVVSASVLNFIKIGLHFPLGKGLRLKLNPPQQEELERLLYLCLRHHASRDFPSKRFLGLV